MAAPKKKVVKKPAKKSVRTEAAKDPEVQKLREELFEAKEELKEREELLSKKEESTKGSEKVSDVMVAHTETKQVEQEEKAEEKAEEAPKPASNASQSDAGGEESRESTEVAGEEEKKEEENTESEPDSNDGSSNGKEEKSSKKSLLVLGVIFLFVGGIIGIFIFSSLQYFSNVKEEKKQQEEVIPTIALTSTPTPEVSYDSYSLQVLNGSGISGQAAQTAGVLEDQLGFSSDNVSVGNATDDVTDTTVQLQVDIPASVFDDIKKALPEFTVVLGDPLAEDNDNDVVVTLGTKQE